MSSVESLNLITIDSLWSNSAMLLLIFLLTWLIDTLLGFGLGSEFLYIQTGDVCTYPHYFRDRSNL